MTNICREPTYFNDVIHPFGIIVHQNQLQQPTIKNPKIENKSITIVYNIYLD